MATYEEELKRIRAKYETQRRLGNRKVNTLSQQTSNEVVANQTPQEQAVQNAEPNGWEKIWAGADRIGTNLMRGVAGAFEGVMDFGATVGANVGKWFGADTTDLENFIKTDYASQIAEQRINTGNTELDKFLNNVVFSHNVIPDIIGTYIDSNNDWYQETQKIKNYSNSGQALPEILENTSQGVGSALGFATLGTVSGGIGLPAKVAQYGSMFTSATGKGVEESLNQGHDLGQATLYGLGSGAIETATEMIGDKVLGALGLGTGKFAGVLGGTAGKRATKEVTGSIAKRGLATGVKQILKNFTEEGFEEVLSDLANPILQQIAYGDTRSYGEIFEENGGWENVVQSFIYGGLSGALFEGVHLGSTVKQYGLEGNYLLGVTEQLGEANEELKRAVKSGNQERIDKAQNKINNIYSNNIQMFNQYVDMLDKLNKETGFNLKDLLNEKGEIDNEKVKQLNKGQLKSLNRENLLYDYANAGDTVGDAQAKLLQERFNKYNKNNNDKLDLNIVSKKDFAQAQIDNGSKKLIDSANAFFIKDNTIYVNKDSKAYKEGKLFSTVGHEITHGLENTQAYKTMRDEAWNSLTEQEQQDAMAKYNRIYNKQNGLNRNSESLMREWFADYIGENVMSNYKGFAKQFKKTNVLTRAIMRYTNNVTVKSALDERRTNANKNVKYGVTEKEKTTSTVQKTAVQYQLEEKDNGRQERGNLNNNEEVERRKNATNKWYKFDKQRTKQYVKKDFKNRGNTSKWWQNEFNVDLQTIKKYTTETELMFLDKVYNGDCSILEDSISGRSNLVRYTQIMSRFAFQDNYENESQEEFFTVGEMPFLYDFGEENEFEKVLPEVVIKEELWTPEMFEIENDFKKLGGNYVEFCINSENAGVYNTYYNGISVDLGQCRGVSLLNLLRHERTHFFQHKYNDIYLKQQNKIVSLINNIDDNVKLYNDLLNNDKHGNYYYDEAIKNINSIYRDEIIYTVNEYRKALNLPLLEIKQKKYKYTAEEKNIIANDYQDFKILNEFMADTFALSENILNIYEENGIRKQDIVEIVNQFMQEAETKAKEEKNKDFEILYQLEDSNGDDISPAMENWNKGNKFVDDEGRILRLYHGSGSAGFMEFNDDTPIFLTDEFEVAGSYGGNYNLVNTRKYESAKELIDDFYENYDSEKDAIQDIVPVKESKEAQDYIKREIKQWQNAITEKFSKDPTMSRVARNKIKGLETALNEGYYATYEDGDKDIYDNEKDLLYRFQIDNQEMKNYGYDQVLNTLDDEDVPTGNTIYALYAKATNPLTINARGNSYAFIMFRGMRMTTDEIAEIVKKEGKHDGIIFKNIMDNGYLDTKNELGLHNVYVVFKANQVKAKDNLNPTSANDIRYQLNDEGEFNKDLAKRKALRMIDTFEKGNRLLAEQKSNDIMQIGIKISKAETKEQFDKIYEDIRALSKGGKEAIEELTGVKKVRDELTAQLNKVVEKHKLASDDKRVTELQEKIASITSVTDLYTEEGKARSTKDNISNNILKLDNTLEYLEEEQIKQAEKQKGNQSKKVFEGMQKAIKKSYIGKEITTFERFEAEWNRQLEDYRTQLTEIGMSSEEIDNTIKSFDDYIDIVKDNFNKYNKLISLLQSKTTFNFKPILNDLITLESDEILDDTVQTRVLEKIDKMYEEVINKNYEQYDKLLEKALEKKDKAKIEENSKKAEELYDLLNKWLLPKYQEYSKQIGLTEDKYNKLKADTYNLGILADDYSLDNASIKEVFEADNTVKELDKSIEANNEVLKKQKEPAKIDTSSQEQVRKVIKERVVKEVKVIKDGVRKKSVDSVSSVKDWAEAHNEKYYNLETVNTMIELIDAEVKNLGLEFRFYFNTTEGKEVVADTIHKMLNNYKKMYSNDKTKMANLIFDELMNGAEMKLPSINKKITWQKIQMNDEYASTVEKQVKQLIKENIEQTIENSSKPTILARAISGITNKYKKIIEQTIKEDNIRYESIKKELEEVRGMLENGIKGNRTTNTKADSKEVQELAKEVAKLREEINKMMSTPSTLVRTNVEAKLKKEIADTKKKIREMKIVARNQSTRIAMNNSNAYGKVSIDVNFRKNLTSSLKEVFGKGFEIDNQVYISTVNELSKGGKHIEKATEIFFDYLKKLQIDNNFDLEQALSDEDFKASLQSMFETAYNSAEPSKAEKIRNEFRERTERVKEKAKLQKETFAVADKILKTAKSMRTKLDQKNGGVQQPVAVQVQKLAQIFAKLSRVRLFSTDVRKAILEFDDYYNSVPTDANGNAIEGETRTVGEMIGIEMPQDLKDMIKALRTKYTGDNKVSLDELKMYSKIVRGINKFIERANGMREVSMEYYDTTTGERVETTKTAYEWAEETILRQKNIQNKLGDVGLLNQKLKSFIDPRLVFEQLDGFKKDGFYNMMYQRLQDSQTKYEGNYLSLENVINEFAKDKANKKFLKSFNKQVEIAGIKCTTGEMLSLYKLLRREQAVKHLLNSTGGFMIGNKLYNQFNTKEKVDQLRSDIENYFDLNNSSSTASKFIDTTIKFFDKAKKLKIETDLELKGFTNVEAGEYFPIKISSLSRVRSIAEMDYTNPFQMQGALNYSFNQNVKGSTGSMVIGSIDDIMTTHLKQISMYNAYATTLDTFQSMYNLKLGHRGDINSGESIGSATKSRFKTKGNNYFLDSYLNTLFGDIQGVKKTDTDGISGFFNKVFGKIRSAYASFQLGANINVMGAQLASIPASLKYIKLRHLVKALVPFKTNVPIPDIALFRKSDKSIIYAQTLNEKVGTVGQVFSKGILATDSMAINLIWRASLLQTANQDGSFNTDKATDLFTKALRETQPNYSALDRSELLRSKNELLKSITMFTTQPAKNFTNFVEAVSIIKTKMALKEKVTLEDKKYVARSLTGLVIQGALYTAIGEFFKKFLKGFKDDEDQDGIINWFVEFFNDNVIGMLPILNRLFGIEFTDQIKIKTNPLELSSFETLNDIISNGQALFEGNMNWKTFADTVGMITGVPTNNIYKYIVGALKTMQLEEPAVTAELAYKGIKVGNKTEINEALKNGQNTRAKILYRKYVSNIADADTSTVDKLFEMYKNGQDVAIKKVPSKITVNDEEITIDQTKFRTTYNKAFDKISLLTNNGRFKSLTDEQQTYIINRLLNSYYNLAKTEQNAGSVTAIEKILSCKNIKASTLIHLAKLNSIEATDKKSRKELVVAYIKKQPLQAKEKYLLYLLAGYKAQDKTKKALKTYLRTLGLTTKDIQEILEG